MEIITHKNKSKVGEHLSSAIAADLNWLSKVLYHLDKINSGTPEEYSSIHDIELTDLSGYSSPYADFINRNNFSFQERIIIVLSLSPHLQPSLLDIFKTTKPNTLFGGVTGKNHHGFLPTGETAVFIIAGDDLVKRLQLLSFFSRKHLFYRDNILYLEDVSTAEPELSGALIASPDFVDLVLRGTVRKPDLRPDFPAKLLSTEMDWNDVVLTGITRSQLSEIESWIVHSKSLFEDPVMGKKLKPGFRALFYGPPGTGKTLSACLIGKKTGRDVYRVDLSTIVSKYIGETEKNLARLFDRASRKDWILFFDEADALFGKRTDVNDSHDRYANQEVSYLLQRIEYHEGLVILATNMKTNIDSAFLRRFQSIIYFPMPKYEERLALWKKAFSETIPPDAGIDMEQLARKYELSGSLINNIVSHATLRAFHEKAGMITPGMLQDGIARELAKEGKTL
ncbi:MAG: ATPase, family [Bacteroidetes bacterium]|nr:ATPase, family [Bacteroidota bacterium]